MIRYRAVFAFLFATGGNSSLINVSLLTSTCRKFAGFLVFAESNKEAILKDAAQVQADLHATIAKITAKGFKGMTDNLSDIEQSIAGIVAKLSKEIDQQNITKLSMEFLQLKNRLFYEQMSVDSDVLQSDTLAKKAAILIDQIKEDIKALEAAKMLSQAEVLKIDLQQLELFSVILKKETTREPLHYIESLLSAVERNMARKLSSVELELKRIRVEKKPSESYYQVITITFNQALNMVLNNLRAEGKFKTADDIQQLALYVSGLEKMKASGAYRGTEMEHTLDMNIRVKKTQLINIINQMLRY